MNSKTFWLMGAMAVLYSGLALSVETNICITNKSRDGHIIKVPAVDSHDWSGERPDHNFNNISISSGSTICRREDISYFSNPQFAFRIDGTETWLYYKSGYWISKQLVDKPNALYGTGSGGESIDSLTPMSNLPGGPCNGTRCSKFVIRGEPTDSKGEVVSPHNWMKFIDNDALLRNITIPGTHDSAAYDGSDSAGRSFYIAQYMGTSDTTFKGGPKMSIFNQLQSGVRFIDARLHKVGDTCTLHHGKYFLGQDCKKFFHTIYKWLAENPSETIVMSIKTEGEYSKTSWPIERIVNKIVNEVPWRWYVGETVPTLGENTTVTGNVERDGTNARGRIVLIRRYGMEYYVDNKIRPLGPMDPNLTYGLDGNVGWPGNNWGRTGANNDGLFWVQDEYSGILFSNKWYMFSHTLDEASKAPEVSSDPIWYINFASATYGIPSPYGYATDMNPSVKEYFQKNYSGHYGIVILDFISPELAKMIYGTNFAGGWGSN